MKSPITALEEVPGKDDDICSQLHHHADRAALMVTNVRELQIGQNRNGDVPRGGGDALHRNGGLLNRQPIGLNKSCVRSNRRRRQREACSHHD